MTQICQYIAVDRHVTIHTLLFSSYNTYKLAQQMVATDKSNLVTSLHLMYNKYLPPGHQYIT